jgi:hypothetical protein
MMMPDVNVLVHAHRPDMPHHALLRQWLVDLIADTRTFGMCDLVLSGFLRVVTNRRIFKNPTPANTAWEWCNRVLASPRCLLVRPSSAHWGIFERLCRSANATGDLVPDAFYAALAIDSGCEWVTLDRDYALFPGLTWRDPVANRVITNPM